MNYSLQQFYSIHEDRSELYSEIEFGDVKHYSNKTLDKNINLTDLLKVQTKEIETLSKLIINDLQQTRTI